MINIPYKICTLIILLMFLVGFKTSYAQILLQPEIGTITSINNGTDRIVEMLREEDDKDEVTEAAKTPNKSESNEISQTVEEKSEDVEVFFPPSKLENKNNLNYSTKNDKDEVINENMPQKTIQRDSKMKYKSKNNNPEAKVITSVSGGLQKVNTGNGGEIKNHISGMDTAWVREIKNPDSKIIVGGVIDYNHNSYDNEVNGVNGNGNSDALTIGVLAKHINNKGFYYEGSARLGRAKTDFQSNSLYKAQYEESAPVYAGHARLGKIIDLNKQNSVDVYGSYSFAHQDRLNLRPSSNEYYNLGSIDSDRLKAGCRMTTRVDDNGKIYYGLAYQYETDSRIKARQNGNVVDSASSRGSTGLIELGYKLSASKDKTSSIDLNAASFTGRQKGFTIKAQFLKML